MSEQRYVVVGNINFPLVFKIKATSKENAIKYANKVLNDQDVLKAEVEFLMKDNKHPLLIADEMTICWSKAEEE